MEDVTKLARKLEPFLQRQIERAVAGGVAVRSSAGAGAGVVPSPHTLDGEHHSGTLSWGSVNKAGSSLADLATRSHGDLSGVSANQHHNQVHTLAGSDHTASGLTAGHTLRATAATTFAWAQLQHGDLGGVAADQHHAGFVALTDDASAVVSPDANDRIKVAGGAGLTSTAGTNVVTLAVGAGAGITVNANDVALNTPGTLSVSSASSASGNHTHAVSASSNPGAAAALLKSTATGGLTLESFVSNGEITAGESLYAGSNGFRVIHHTDDYAHVHVVINPGGSWSLDEQFGLDVDDNLLVRGWIVGKHAIQLEGAKLIAHYDGPEPYETNYTGNPTGHMGQVATVSGGVIYRPGKFGKAVQVADATTNLVTNPSFESAATGYFTWYHATASRIATDSYVGSYCATIQSDDGSLPYIYNSGSSLTVSAGTSYTFSAWVKGVDAAVGRNCVIYLRENGGASPHANTSTTVALTDEWQRVSVTRTIVESDRDAINHYIYYSSALTDGAMLIDGIQLEQRSSATPYADGSLGDGHSWSGTEHASTSSRTAARLSYASNNLDYNRGTVMLWANMTAVVSGNQWAFYRNTVGGRVYIIKSSSDDKWYGGLGDNAFLLQGTAVEENTWVHLALTWDGASGAFYVNGELMNGAAYSGLSDAATDLFVGRPNSAGSYLNGTIDELVIADRALDADEIRAIYESNAPVFAETSTWHWRSASNKVWADSEGLWAISESGAVLGLYAEAGTKSWGGVTLGTNDLLIGDSNRGGYLHWDDSAATFKLADVDIELHNGSDQTVAIGADGDVFFGADVTDVEETFFASFGVGQTYPLSAPIHAVSETVQAGDLIIGDQSRGNVFWDKSAGQLKFRDNVTVQSYIDTDGSYVAGATKLNVDGLSVVTPTSWSEDASVKFVDGSGNILAELYTINPSGSKTTALRMEATTTVDSNMILSVQKATGEDASLSLSAGSLTLLMYHPNSGDRYFSLSGGPVFLPRITAPGTPGSSGGYLYVDTADGDLKVKFQNGITKTIATDN